jgi:alcohol dehydrogenase class IV
VGRRRGVCGKALPVPGPLKPLMAIPTTAGTGSETTGVAIMDIRRLHLKTGISSRRLKPTLAYLDPDNTRTMPPEVAASSGLDILSHAIESFTAMPYTGRPCRTVRRCGRHIRDRIRSAMCGRCRRCGWWRNF